MKKINIKYRLKFRFAAITLLTGFLTAVLDSGCKKLVEVNAPITSINVSNVYAEDATAIAVMNGIYTTMSNNYQLIGGITSMSYYPGLSADELTLYPETTGTALLYYQNMLTSNTTITGFHFWSSIYPLIYDANAVIQGVTASTALTPVVKKQLLGEAQFIRAFCYFYLVNLYGDVPLALTTDYKINANLPRTDQVTVYAQIIADLKSAQSLLSSNYLDVTLLKTTTEKVRPTSWAAAALLARVYLYEADLSGQAADFTNAANQATKLISNSPFSLSPLTGTEEVFTANSEEAIWQLQPVIPGFNTTDAELFILPPTGPNNYSYVTYLSKSLLTAFEPGDQRRSDWVDSVLASGKTYYYAYKYQSATLNAPVTEYEMVFRLAEQYLIRAEAEANLNDMTSAARDLNIIRKRAGLQPSKTLTSGATLDQAENAILQERQVELFTEWGHRWLDLKRTKTVNGVMNAVAPLKGGTWNTNDQLYPVPLTELQADPALKQNPGY